VEKVVERLDKINKTLEGIRDLMGKPENKFLIALQYGSGVVAIFGVIAIIDIIVKWIIGG
jgi:hypothetical protein